MIFTTRSKDSFSEFFIPYFFQFKIEVADSLLKIFFTLELCTRYSFLYKFKQNENADCLIHCFMCSYAWQQNKTLALELLNMSEKVLLIIL